MWLSVAQHVSVDQFMLKERVREQCEVSLHDLSLPHATKVQKSKTNIITEKCLKGLSGAYPLTTILEQSLFGTSTHIGTITWLCLKSSKNW